MNTVAPSLSIIRQLVQFFGLAYAISWLIWSPYYLPMEVPVNQLPYVHLLGSLGPMLAAVILIYREQGPKGLRQLGGQTTSIRRMVRWLSVGILAPVLILVLMISFVCITQRHFPDWQHLFSSAEFGFLSPAVYILYTIFFFGLGEEVGWRGFVLPRLQRQHSAFTANLIIVGFWAIWHWPLFLNPLGGYRQMDIGGIIGWLFSLFTGGLLFTWLFNSSRGNVLACALFHGLMDVVFLADLDVPQLATYTGMLITLWGIYVWLVYKPANLSNFPKITAS
ncbi:CPBP family intramembrane glutamic endopeptidase [Spirosoma sp. KNUC1025]|uniref:CPBP family intramembrane glutamic endopeptidase n=1 Tax=Spirosoma sp. KNUC1025 TaxID=2894082 RepID=UPI0038705E09|nr:CPBP family intramembrane metalloprotease [Spirosoma sp. KNUC1025]